MTVDTYAAKATASAGPSSTTPRKGQSNEHEQALTKALEDLHIDKYPEDTESSDAVAAAEVSPIDPALVDAMRNSRDREFVCRYEKEMEVRILDETVTQWEVPLMNSYQRLLVHRIADHFQLEHTIDLITKKVSLRKHEATHVPEQSISFLASQERLSEPATNSLSSLLSGRSGTSTPSSIVSAPSAPLSVRIMRRDDMSSESSQRGRLRGQGSCTPDDVNGQKDRRNMTIEEREEAYRQARQRIFGSESEPSLTGESDADSSVQASRIPDHSPSEPLIARSSQASSSSSASSQIKNEERHYEETYHQYGPYPTLDPGMRQAPSGYPFPAYEVQQQSQLYPAGQWYDAYGRPLYHMNQHFPPYAAMTSPNSFGNIPAEYVNHSPSSSSRSTSISAGPDNRDSRQNSISDQAHLNTAASGLGYSAPVSRSNSTSPSVPYPRLSPSFSGTSTPGYVNGTMPMPANAWPMHYPHTPPPNMIPSQVEHQSGGPWPPNGARPPPMAGPTTGPRAWQTIPVSAPGNGGYRAYQGSALPMIDPSGYAMMNSRNKPAGRGRRSQGAERSLYDPNKPDAASGGGSVDVNATKPESSPSVSTRTGSVSSASSSRTGDGVSTLLSRPFHSSLPARPDWAVPQRTGNTDAVTEETGSS